MNADYDEMGRELLESLGLTGLRGQAEFNDLDPIWRESTGGCIYVRNEAAARWDGPAWRYLPPTSYRCGRNAWLALITCGEKDRDQHCM